MAVATVYVAEEDLGCYFSSFFQILKSKKYSHTRDRLVVSHLSMVVLLRGPERLQRLLHDMGNCNWIVRNNFMDDMYGIIGVLDFLDDHIHRFSGGSGTSTIDLGRSDIQIGANRVFVILWGVCGRNINRGQRLVWWTSLYQVYDMDIQIIFSKYCYQ